MSTKEFSSLTAFLVHMAEVQVALRVAEHHALESAAKVIEKNSRAKFGEYQHEAGQFPAWAELQESTKEERARLGFTENDPLLRDGKLLRDSISHEVHGSEAVVGSTEPVMLFHEVGTSKMPPRPVLGPAAIESHKQVQEILGKSVMHALEYGTTGGLVRLPE